MRRSEPVKLGEIVSDFFRSSERLSRMLAEARAVTVWPEIAGREIAGCTTRINVKNGRMWVYISSSAVKHEVFMNRSAIMRDMNIMLGAEIIKSIIVK